MLHLICAADVLMVACIVVTFFCWVPLGCVGNQLWIKDTIIIFFYFFYHTINHHDMFFFHIILIRYGNKFWYHAFLEYCSPCFKSLCSGSWHIFLMHSRLKKLSFSDYQEDCKMTMLDLIPPVDVLMEWWMSLLSRSFAGFLLAAWVTNSGEKKDTIIMVYSLNISFIFC